MNEGPRQYDPHVVIAPICCAMCGSDRYNRTRNQSGVTKEPLVECRACGYLYTVREGKAALERKYNGQ